MWKKQFKLTLSLLLLSAATFGQTYFSPFSRFAAGELQSSAMVNQRAMGGLSVLTADPYRYSIDNPATYAGKRNFTLETGLNLNMYQISNSTQKYNGFDYRLPYISLAIPIVAKYNWAFSGGIVPYSKTGYQLRTTTTLPTPSITEIEGKGGLTRAYFGNGISFGGLSIGISGNYMFGNNTQTSYLQFPDSLNYMNLSRANKQTIKGFRLDWGINYKIQGDSSSFTIGLMGNMPAKLNTINSTEVLTYRLNRSIIYDSIATISYPDNSMTLPASFGLGLMFHKKDRLAIGIEGKYEQWSQYKVNNEVQTSFGDAITLRAGMQYRQKPQDKQNAKGETKYRSGAFYRAGFKYGQSYILSSDGTALNDMSISLGMGFLLRASAYLKPEARRLDKNRPQLDLSIELGQLGKPSVTDFQSRYILFSLGIHIFEPVWFEHSKIE